MPKLLAAILLGLILSGAAQADPAVVADDGGPDAWNIDWADGAIVVSTADRDDAPANVDGPITEIRPVADGPEDWRAQLRLLSGEPVVEGEVLLFECFLRGDTASGDEPYVVLLFEKAGQPYTKGFMHATSVATEGWTRVQVPFQAAEDAAAGGMQFGLRLSSPTQRLDIAGLRIVRRPDATVEELPRTPASYPGMAEDADWREEAAERIDTLRKGELQVQVVDAEGRAIKNVLVEVEMTRHAFPFGTAVGIDDLLEDSPDASQYREVLAAWFNYATIENGLKQQVIAKKGMDRAVLAARWLLDANIVLRGHTLLWPGMHRWYMPKDLREEYQARAEKDPDGAAMWLKAALDQHLVDKAMTMRGLVVGWDVANEVANNRELMEAFGDVGVSDDVLASWFRMASEVDPKAELYLNDFGIVVDDGSKHEVRKRYIRQAQNLVDANVRVDAIGVQAHFFGHLTGPRNVWRIYDELAETGVPIEVTEFDVGTGDEVLDGQFTRDFMTASFAHEHVKSFIVWGFWEGRHWRPETAMFRRDWSIRPSGEAWQDLVLGEWWTDETVQTDDAGVARVRGFLGDYIVRVGGQEVRTTLPRGGRSLRIELAEDR